MDDGDLEKEEVKSVIIGDKEPLMTEERQRIIKIMSRPIKATSTKLYYIANDRQKNREILNKGIF